MNLTPPRTGFKAFIDPKLVAQRLGPRDPQMTIEKFEPKAGDSYRYIHRRGEHSFGFHGVVHEVTALEHIIQTFEFEGLPEKGHVTLETARFEAMPGSRTKLTVQSAFQSVTHRDGYAAVGYGKRRQQLARAPG